MGILGVEMSSSSEVIASVQSGDVERLRALLASEPSLAAVRDGNGISAIMQALYCGRKDIVELLLAAHPEPDIFEATAAGRNKRVVELLSNDPAVARTWSADGFTALHLAAFFGQEAIAVLLLQHGADASAEARNSMKVTPLHSAAAAHNLAIARALLERGAPANARQQLGWTTLHEAAQNGDNAMVQLLLEHGADPNLANDDGITPAQLATKKGHTEIARLLA
jgi:ankyrin repeat protein